LNISGEILNENPVSVAGISIKEELLITGGLLKAYSISGAGVEVWSHNEETMDHVCISRDDRSLAASSSNIIKLLDIASGRETRRLVDHSSGVTCISSFSRSPYQWISGDDEGVARVSDARRHPSTLIALRQSRPVRCAYSSPDDSLIVIGDDSCFNIYDMRQRKLLSRFIHSTIGVCFHPGERLMSSFGGEGIIRYWDLDTLECVSQSEPFNDTISDAHFSFQGESLIVCSSDRVRCLSWEPCTLEWSHHISSTLISSHLDKDDKLRLIVSDSHTNMIKVLSSPLSQMESLLTGEKYEEVMKEATPVIEIPSSSHFQSPNNDVMFLCTRKDEERSIKVVSHSPTLQSTPSKSSTSSINRLTKATSRMNLDDEKKRKFEERKGSLKRKEGKSSVDIMSMIDEDHPSVIDDLNGASLSLRGIRDAFRRGNIQQVIDVWTRDRNMALLSTLCRQCTYRNKYSLSLSLTILPHLTLLLSSIHRELRASAILALTAIMNSIGDLVNTMTRGNGMPNSIGVDVAAEDRMRMCKSIEKELVLLQLRENDMLKVMSDDERAQISSILALFPS
ncbi:hypothetical protein PENTCL1PPCAC_22721, partial [Pristionchus entomophagus]